MKLGILSLLTVLTCSAAVTAQQRPTHVFIPNAGGDVTEAIGAAMASDVSTLLVEKGIEALTLANLKAQLKEQQYKELLGCDKKQGCVEERIDSFGYADRIFVQVIKLGEQAWQLEVSHFVKGRLKRGGKLTQKVNCPDQELGGLAAEMVLKLLDLSRPDGSKTPNEKWTPDGGSPWAEPR